VTAQMNRAAWFHGPSEVLTLEAPRIEVDVDGVVDPRVGLDSVEAEMGRAPRAVFSVGLGRSPGSGQEVRLEHRAPRVVPGQPVRARLLRGGVLPGAARRDLVVFEGRILDIEMGLDAEGERLQFEAEDLAGEVFRRRVGGQRIRTAAGPIDRMEGPILAFNPNGEANAAPEPYVPDVGESYTVFAPTSPEGAVAWTLDEAVAYLLAEHGASEVLEVPSPSEVRGLLAALPVRDVEVEGRTFGEALQALLDPVGGCVLLRVEPGEVGVSRRLELWLPAKTQTVWLSHQPVGETYASGRTQFRAINVAMHFESAPRRYVARGDRGLFESTFDLVPGWNDALAYGAADTYSPSTNAGFDTVRDVFRKWVLNEAGEYSAAPYSRGAAPDLSALFEGAPYVRCHRRFLPCISCDALGRSYGVHAEMSLDGGSTWERLSLGARVLAGECGIYLADDVLSMEYLVAAMRGQVRVRVTATIESDARLTAERVAVGFEDLPGRTCHLSVPGGYRLRRVASTSRFYGVAGADEADDTARLQALVDSAFEADRRSPVLGRVEIPYLGLEHRVGERLGGTRGRRVDLAREPPGYGVEPVVWRIRHEFAPMPSTTLDLG